MDELSVYLRKLKVKERDAAGGQLTAFLTALFKAVESTPNAAVVYTLAIGKGGKATDAYSDENQFIADKMEEAESVSARKAALLDPTEEDETVRILRRRLFTHIDDARATAVIEAYRQLWEAHKEQLPPAGSHDSRLDAFTAGFPLHPELIDTLREKTSTLGNFQRVRGMLRLLARTVARIWDKRPTDAYAIHLHHLDPGFEPIRQEIVTRLGQRQFVPAIKSDVAAVEGDQPALAQQLDAAHYTGLAPYGSYVGRAILFHTLAFNENLKGATAEELRYAVLSPGTDISFIDDARRRFVQESAYLDDRPNVPLRFSAEANLTQILRREEQHVDPGEARAQLNDRIKAIFGGAVFNLYAFPGGPYDVPDDTGDGKPDLALLGYDAVEVAGDNVVVPELVGRIYRQKGASGDLRLNRNNLVFLLADQARKDEMKHKMVRRLALNELRKPERLNEFAEHQRDRILEWYRRSEQELALAIQQCYRHVLYPSRNRVEGAERGPRTHRHRRADRLRQARQRAEAGRRGPARQQQAAAARGRAGLAHLHPGPHTPEEGHHHNGLAARRVPPRSGPAHPGGRRRVREGHPQRYRAKRVRLPERRPDLRQGRSLGQHPHRRAVLCPHRGLRERARHLAEGSRAHARTGSRPRPEPRPNPWPRTRADTRPNSGTYTRTRAYAPRENADRRGRAQGGPDQALGAGAIARKLTHIRAMDLKLFDPSDAFRLLGLVGAIQHADKKVVMTGGYETTDGGIMELNFEGPPADAQPIKDFLDPQLRAAKDKDLSVTFSIAFAEDGLGLAGDAPEKLAERLTKFGTGASYVAITAEGGQ